MIENQTLSAELKVKHFSSEKAKLYVVAMHGHGACTLSWTLFTMASVQNYKCSYTTWDTSVVRDNYLDACFNSIWF